MTKDEALKLALKALGAYMSATDSEEDAKAHSLMAEAFFKIKEALNGCQCQECQTALHASDCAVHSGPAYPKGECNCGAQQYNVTSDHKLMENAQGDLERIKLVQTGVGIALTSQERDAQRWRFLMNNSYDSESVTQFHVWEHSWEPHSKTGEPTEWKQRVRGIALIDFIDRAIEAAHGIKGKNT